MSGMEVSEAFLGLLGMLGWWGEGGATVGFGTAFARRF